MTKDFFANFLVCLFKKMVEACVLFGKVIKRNERKKIFKPFLEIVGQLGKKRVWTLKIIASEEELPATTNII